jgi:hypothetical protein
MTAITVFGNGALDAQVNGKYRVKGDTITVESNNVERTLHIVDGPFHNGVKHRSEESLDEFIEGMDVGLVPRGGAFNSLRAMVAIGNGTPIAILSS